MLRGLGGRWVLARPVTRARVGDLGVAAASHPHLLKLPLVGYLA